MTGIAILIILLLIFSMFTFVKSHHAGDLVVSIEKIVQLY